MSQFLDQVRRYSRGFGVSKAAELGLIAHYPLFKLAWYSLYGTGPRRALARLAIGPFAGYQFSHAVRARGGRQLRIPVPFQVFHLASFQEIFWGEEYRLPEELRECRTLVDLGANTGMATLYFALKTDLEKAVLVEANPELIPVLKRNLGELLGQQAFVEHCLVSGAEQGEAELHISANHRFSSTREGDSDVRKVRVRKVPLRALLEKHGLESVDLLKMDIEGGEYEILDRDPEVLKKFRHLFVEILGPVAERARFIAGLEALGFRVLFKTTVVDACETLFASRAARAS